MKDYLRRNSKWILAIFSIFLMLAWVANPRNKDQSDIDAAKEMGTLDGKKVTKGEMTEAVSAIAILKSLGGTRMIGSDGQPMLDQLGRERVFPSVWKYFDLQQPEVHLYLMLTEAKHYHITASAEEASEMFGITSEDDVLALTRGTRVDSSSIRQAMLNFAIAYKLRELSMPGGARSLPEARRLAAESQTKLDAKYIVFDASTPPTDIKEPSPEELAAQFDAYKSVLPLQFGPRPAINGHEYPFGYKRADRVKVEYLVFNHDEVRKLPTMESKDDLKDALTQYTNNTAQYPRPADFSTTAPQSPNLTFDEAKPQILNEIIDKRVADTVKDMANYVESRTQATFTTFDANGLRVIPKETDLVSYDVLANELQERFGYKPAVMVGSTVAQPATQAATGPATASAPAAKARGPAEWLDPQQLYALPGIGMAQSTNGESFVDLALNVQELHPDRDRKRTKATYLQLQKGLEGYPVVDGGGNMYVYRVLDVDPTHEPKLEEVKEQVALDFKKLTAYKRYLEGASKWVETAKTGGIGALAIERALPVNEAKSFSPAQASLPNVGEPETEQFARQGPQQFAQQFSQQFARAVMHQALLNAGARLAASPATTAASAPATQPAIYLGKGHPVDSFPSEKSLRLYLFEVTDVALPVNDDNFKNVVSSYMRSSSPGPDPTSLPAIAQRLKFIPATPFDSAE